MTVNPYDIGQAIRLTGAFADSGGNPADPTTIELRVQDPAGTVTILTYAGGQLVRDSVGSYHYDFLAAIPGRHAYRWTGGGAVQTSKQARFLVLRNYF
jgi:hypothetical protein